MITVIVNIGRFDDESIYMQWICMVHLNVLMIAINDALAVTMHFAFHQLIMDLVHLNYVLKKKIPIQQSQYFTQFTSYNHY